MSTKLVITVDLENQEASVYVPGSGHYDGSAEQITHSRGWIRLAEVSDGEPDLIAHHELLRKRLCAVCPELEALVGKLMGADFTGPLWNGEWVMTHEDDSPTTSLTRHLAALNELVDPMREAVVGYRNSLVAKGMGQGAADECAVDFHHWLFGQMMGKFGSTPSRPKYPG